MQLIGIIIIELLFSSFSHALINGTPLNGMPDLVRLEFESKESVCTGFYISPNYLITAAHCLFSWKDHHTLKLENIITENEEKILVNVEKQIPHPQYYTGGWSPNDVAIIKTTNNTLFNGGYILTNEETRSSGGIILYGAGKIDIEKNIFGRVMGTNHYFKIFSFMFSFGKPAIAPNDSGAPIVDQDSNRVIGIGSKTTVTMMINKIFPTVSIMTSLREKSNANFIQENTK